MVHVYNVKMLIAKFSSLQLAEEYVKWREDRWGGWYRIVVQDDRIVYDNHKG